MLTIAQVKKQIQLRFGAPSETLESFAGRREFHVLIRGRSGGVGQKD
jgi:hypothetical protein